MMVETHQELHAKDFPCFPTLSICLCQQFTNFFNSTELFLDQQLFFIQIHSHTEFRSQHSHEVYLFLLFISFQMGFF